MAKLSKASDYYKKRTPEHMRRIGDAMLVGCGSLSTAAMGLPVSDNIKLWIVFILNLFGTGAKIFTNYFKEEDVVTDQDTTQPNAEAS